MIGFYSGGGENPENNGKTENIQANGIPEKTYQFRRKKPEIRDTREDFITFFNTFNKNLIKME